MPLSGLGDELGVLASGVARSFRLPWISVGKSSLEIGEDELFRLLMLREGANFIEVFAHLRMES